MCIKSIYFTATANLTYILSVLLYTIPVYTHNSPSQLSLLLHSLLKWNRIFSVFSPKELKELKRDHVTSTEDDIDSDDETRIGNGNISSTSAETHHRSRKHQIARIRQSNTERSLQAKKRVIKMLFVVVLEFFVFWTPMYIMNTWFVFDNKTAMQHVSPAAMNFIHLMSYVSSCCNPITYCFMNKKFRQGFLSAFRCCLRKQQRRHIWRSTTEYSTGRTGKQKQSLLSRRMHLTKFCLNTRTKPVPNGIL